MDELVEFITRSHEAHRPARMHDVRKHLMMQWRIAMLDNTLHHVLARDPRLKSVTAKPMEDKRTMVDPGLIDDYFNLLFGTVSGTPAAFVFNVDEMGHQPWADAVDSVCFVPSWEMSSVVYYPVSRTGKRITLIACIAADGSYIRPSLILARQTYEDEILLTGLTNDKVEIYSQAHSFINGPIFEDWFKDSFCPDLQRRRDQYEYWGPAYLILDNCTAHRGELFEHLCHENSVEPIFLPPHSSNQIQPLDLCLFGHQILVSPRKRLRESMNLKRSISKVSTLLELLMGSCPPLFH
jgi:hypothetical protein